MMAHTESGTQDSGPARELVPDDLIAVAADCRGVLAGAPDADWTQRAGDLDWTCRRTLDHMIDTLLHYAAHLSTRATGRLPFIRDGDSARSVPELLTSLSTSATILAEVCRAAPPEARGFHPAGHADRSGFLAMGCQEVLSHTFDITTGLGIPFRPTDPSLVRLVVDRIFPWAPKDHEAAPWDALLWAAGRIALPDRPRLDPNWWWHAAPLTEWDGTVKRRTAETPPGWT